jgi:spore coat protein A
MKNNSTSDISALKKILALAFFLTGPGAAYAAFIVPQTHHPGVFFEKYATPLPYFAGARVGGTNITVSYEEFRQRVLPETFYDGGGPFALPPALPPYDSGTLVWGYKVGGSPPLWPGFTIEAERGTATEVTYVNNLAPAGGHSGPELQRYLTVDQTLHWANPLQLPGPPISRLEEPPYAGPQPVVSHLHGGEVPSAFDGAPDQWMTQDGRRGAGYRSLAGAAANAATYRYPNTQDATTLWFHDHALGITRLNVYAGVAAYYFLRDEFDNGETASANSLGLPSGEHEVEFVIQDRMFDILGNLLFPDGLPYFTPNAQHPFWNPEFLGDVNTVNGRSWPFMTVEPRRYRLRLLNGSNARFYNLSLVASGGGGKGKNKVGTPAFWVIGSDGGLLDTAVQTSDLLIAPGERYDVIIDFGGLADGTTFTLTNDAKSPYPFGGTADPQTVGQIAQFVVAGPAAGNSAFDPAVNPTLRDGTANTPPPIVRLPGTPGGPAIDGTTVQKVRQLTLNEIPGPFGPLDAVLNNTRWGGTREDGTATSTEGLTLNTGSSLPLPSVSGATNWISEMPEVGSTEIWEIVNTTGDAHPIHLHLVQFQVLNRQNYSVRKYDRKYIQSFPGGAAANPNSGIFIPHFGPPFEYNDIGNPETGGKYGGNPNVDPYLSKGPIAPAPYEMGWKDTVIALPKQVTRIVVRFTPQDVAFNPADAGLNKFAFDPTAIGNPAGGIVSGSGNEGGPGYVWHCHIIDHEDNEMMRPYVPVNNPNNTL